MTQEAFILNVAIVTDSTACLPRELVDVNHIGIVPVDLIFGDRIYRDGIDLTPSQFYEMLRTAEKLPSTTASSPGAYLKAYVEASQRAEALLCVTVASNLSGLYESALQAAEMARKVIPQLRVEVLDSRTATMAQGFVVLAAARAAVSGESLEGVLDAARQVMPKVGIVAVLDTLYFLVKGGRVPRAVAWAASLLDLKPIIELKDGRVGLLERPRLRGRGLVRLVEILGERVGKSEPLHLAVLHANALEEANQLREMILSRFRCVESYVAEFTPVMGAHTGPGLVGLAFYVGS